MCGIFGYYLKNKSSNVFESKIVFEGLQHRGPDENGSYLSANEKVFLLHTRLSILDLTSNGVQPMVSNCNNFIITFNGEIYNFPQIKHDLSTEGFKFKSQSDTEVLLYFYIHCLNNGIGFSQMLNKLNGIFSFAIYDKGSGNLFLARDSFGVKPLYYINNNGSFYFSSETNVFFKDKNSFNTNIISNYLTYMWNPDTDHVFKDIKKFTPGSYMLLNEGQIIEYKPWYHLPDAYIKKSKSKKSKNYYLNGFKDHFINAVQRQLISDAPLGSFLSGGLDSSSIVAVASDTISDLECYTIDTKTYKNEGVINDLPFAKIAADHLNVNLNIVPVNSSDLEKDLPKMIKFMDEPTSDPAILNLYYICKLAQSNNIKVLLSGAGGDDILTGYRRHSAILFDQYFKFLPNFFKKIILSANSYTNINYPFFRKLNKYLSNTFLEGDEKLINYFRWSNLSNVTELFNDNFKKSLYDYHCNNPLHKFLNSIETRNILDRLLSLEQRFFLTDHNLNYTDKMSMACGVEVRVPFLDQDLVDFTSSIPNCYKHRFGQSKWILKKAMEPLLPKQIIYRPKTGFGSPIRTWIKNDLQPLIDKHLNSDRLAHRGIFNPHKVMNLIDLNNKSKIDASYTIFSLLCIELWLYQNFEQ